MKTYGLQECNTDGTACTSALGNFLTKPGVPASPAGSEKIKGTPCPTPPETPTSEPRPTTAHPYPDGYAGRPAERLVQVKGLGIFVPAPEPCASVGFPGMDEWSPA